ncbi:hypothetical protein FG05_08353 [Fusarium graminearum]|nr:hypothetical protein FG05_08353 [Fusarium graminearum]
MATVGKILKLNSRMDFEGGEMITFEWEERPDLQTVMEDLGEKSD